MKRTGIHRKSKGKGRFGTVLIIVVMLAGFAILLYPTLSDAWNTRVQSHAIAVYDEAVAEMKEEEYSAYIEAADAYNEKLRAIGSAAALATPSLISDYEETLDITGTGIMGYITIDKINIQLPIYHGTDTGVLQIAAGHLEGTSLPVGGEGTHCVISAHRGLPSAKLFTDLDALEVGDTFTITVLDSLLTYEVDQISIVLPDDIENLYIEDGEDYCTLMTCTPYGINTHRLLVRGHRIENEDGYIRVTADAFQIQTFIVAPFLAIPMLIALLVWLLYSTRGESRKAHNRKLSGRKSHSRGKTP